MELRTLLLAFALTGCIPDVEDDVAIVEGPRLLAVQSTPAEAEPAAAVNLSALVANPTDDAAPRVDWQLCLARKPLTELGPVNPVCLTRGGSADDVAVAGRGDGVAVSVPSDACTLFGPVPPPPKSADEPGGRPVDPDTTGGYYQPFVGFLELPGHEDKALGAVRVACGLTGAPRDTLVAFRDAYRANENPAIDSIELGQGKRTTELALDDDMAEAVSVARGREVTLTAHWAECSARSSCTGAESYVSYDRATQKVLDRREGIAVSWYATTGSFDERRTGVAETDPEVTEVETHWTAPSARVPGEVVRLWAVVRDDRGGVSWRAFRLRVPD